MPRRARRREGRARPSWATRRRTDRSSAGQAPRRSPLIGRSSTFGPDSTRGRPRRGVGARPGDSLRSGKAVPGVEPEARALAVTDADGAEAVLMPVHEVALDAQAPRELSGVYQAGGLGAGEQLDHAAGDGFNGGGIEGKKGGRHAAFPSTRRRSISASSASVAARKPSSNATPATSQCPCGFSASSLSATRAICGVLESTTFRSGLRDVAAWRFSGRYRANADSNRSHVNPLGVVPSPRRTE